MRESTFIYRNKDKWDRISADETYSDSEELAKDFVSLLNDVSYAKTHYPYSKLTVYLNKLSARLYNKIYFDGNQRSNPIKEFWMTDFPVIIGKHRKVLYLAVLLFTAFLGLGVLCSYLEPSFIRDMLGDSYLTMTQENIADGKPFGVYDDDSRVQMFARIFANNAYVGLLLFTSGIFFGIGSIYLTFRNGVMIGAFFSIFFQNSLGFDAFFVVMLHGTFELMGLILECMAGMLLGMSLAFPGALSRKQAFLNGLKISAKIYIGTIPFTFLAAVIESFVTYLGEGGIQGTSPFLIVPLAVVLLSSWAVVIWYFFIYARKKSDTLTEQEYFNQIYA